MSRAVNYSALPWCFVLLTLIGAGCGPRLHFRQATVLGAVRDAETQSTRVSLSFEVWDGNNQLTNLSRENFTIYEDGQPQTSESITEAGTEERRVPVVLVLDTSLSMYQANAVEDLKSAARRFQQTLTSNGFEVEVYRFASQIRPIQTVDEIPSTFDETGGERWTSLYAAVGHAFAARTDAIVVVFSDGADNYSQNHGVNGLGAVEMDVLPAQAGGTGAQRVVHTIGFGNVQSERDRQGVPGGQALQRLARNGSFHFAAQPQALESVFQDVADRIRNVYVFDYFSPNLTGQHTVLVEVRVGNRTARTDTMTFEPSAHAVGTGSTGAGTGLPPGMDAATVQAMTQLAERVQPASVACVNRTASCDPVFDAQEEMLALLDGLPPELRQQWTAALAQAPMEGRALMRAGCTASRPHLCAMTETVTAATLPGPPPPAGTPSVGLAFQSVGLQSDALVFVIAPLDGSPAHRAGFQPGDVVLTLDGQPVTGHEPIVQTIQSQPAGTAFAFGIRRAGQEQSITVTSEPAGSAR